MKTFLKIAGIIVILILAAAFILPIFFKGKIIEIAKEEINKSVNAQVDFTDMDLSLFTNFPNFTLSIEGLTIIGKEDFENDTLMSVNAIEVTIDLISVINAKSYEVKKISIVNPDVFIKVLKNGKANYDIAQSEDSQAEISSSEESAAPFKMTLRHFEIVQGKIVYDDESLGMKLVMVDFNHTLSGNFTADQTVLKTVTDIRSMTLNYDRIDYLKNVTVRYRADIDADMKNEIFTLKNNELKLNELAVAFDGSVSMLENDDINLVMTFNAPKTNFKEILSLVPAVYAKDFKTIETSGTMSLNGNVKGVYNENNLPGFVIDLAVENGKFKYPDLPKAVTDINIATHISNKGGDADNTVIDISKLHLNLAGNLFDASLMLKTPVSDLEIDASFKGKMDFATVKDFYPLEKGEELNGSFVADITLKGKMSAIENEQYEQFTALGSMLIKNLTYHSSMFADPLEINLAQVNFAPGYVDLVSFRSKTGKNDFSATGKLENYLPYFLKNKTLKGNLKTTSDFFNVSALMATDEGEEETGGGQTAEDSEEMSVVEVPADIEFYLNTSFKTLVYDNMTISDVSGKLSVKDKKIVIDNLKMNTLQGSITMNGLYGTSDVKNPEIDFNLKINNIDIQESYNTFAIIEKYVPVAKKTEGKMSVDMHMTGVLDDKMSLVYETLTGGGKLETSPIKIQDVNTLNKIAEAIKYEKLKSMDINKIMLEFEFVDGKIMVEPFEIKYNDIDGEISGWTGFDESIEYVMTLNIPRKEFGSAANNALENLVKEANKYGTDFSLGETVPVNITIGGTLSKPVIKTGLGDSGKSTTENIKEKVKEEIKKKKAELSKEAKAKAKKLIDDADAEAQKLIWEAEKQAGKIRKEAQNGAKFIRDEAEKQAQNMIAEGKKNGMLAEMAAKEGAKKVRKEADTQANKLTAEADKKASQLVNAAKKQAADIKKKAQEEADRILKGN